MSKFETSSLYCDIIIYGLTEKQRAPIFDVNRASGVRGWEVNKILDRREDMLVIMQEMLNEIR